MTERLDPVPNPEVLPDAVASRLLARASELDVGRDGGQTVSDLRVAATAAGISARAFDAALSEMHGVAHVRTSDASERRWARAWIGAAAATLAAAGVFAIVRPWGSPSVAQGPPRAVPVEAAETSAPVHVIEAAVASAPVHHVIVSSVNVNMPSVTMVVDRSGELLASLRVTTHSEGQRIGHVHLTNAGGTATTPATLEVSGNAGAVTFRAPEGSVGLELMMLGTWQRVRGHTIRVARDREGGPLRAEVLQPVQ